jgi:hypothetical protein
VIRLLAGEIGIWRRRPEVVAAMIGVVAVSAATWTSGFLSSQASAASLPEAMPGRAEVQQAFLAAYQFPASVVWMLASGIWLFLGVYYIAAATTGGDFVWGTVRTSLLAGRSRFTFVMARLGFLFVLAAVVLALAVGAAVVLPLVLSSGSRPVRGTAVLLGMGAGGLGLALYASAGVTAAILLRDRAAPLLAGAAVIVLQTVVSGLPIWASSPVLEWVPRLLPANALGSLFAHSEQSVGILTRPDLLPSYLQIPWPIAIAISAGWVVAFVVTGVIVFARADITS